MIWDQSWIKDSRPQSELDPAVLLFIMFPHFFKAFVSPEEVAQLFVYLELLKVIIEPSLGYKMALRKLRTLA